MSQTRALFPRFFRISTPKRPIRDKMIVPAPFIAEHGNGLMKHVMFRLPNGVEYYVNFLKEKSKMYGVAGFFGGPPFDATPHCVFSYLGDRVFLVHVFTGDLTEVEYAPTGFTEFAQDKITGIGWKFLYICTCSSACDRGLVRVPDDFSSRFGRLIPNRLSLTLPNGQVFEASYSSCDGVITGFPVFHINDVLMFTHCGNGAFDVVLFGHNGSEKSFSPYASRTGPMVGITSGQFKIQIQQFHLYKYSHGIDILADFKDCTDRWSSGQFLTVSHQHNVFFLEIRKTDRRWKIHAGWVRFAQLLSLVVGDVLVFDPTTVPLAFSVHVYRIANRQ